ncbi:serine/threonine protein kinase [Glaesserella parasuis ZJ0906]|uniref:Serine/threonine protein kinase n=2 Tax=Glaesserella parasuis TaxID=738 RepID=A0A806J1P2_GLAPU|nr:serine/threonine-protein kinase [Glaesserella parasuis]AGO15504.1 serine/threonine protein kinase [Glaesserella parasuis ZJ0906]MDD2164752.1 serine/threonine protein kinase [Glaesserella parasuis]MDG6408730.1 serine/threonine-protein kinase [Glaesserella parasuis]MDP0174188.1 serine/threonine-protein kinase [Glaesserella parasuis]MDP0380022.1 serine/threonine-protein kinase [Glaesserella parasuis]
MTMEKIYSPALVSFKKIREIGQEGRNSKVYLAHDEYMDAEIVVKEIANSKNEQTQRLLKEAQILYASSHPNVVQIQYACKDDNNVYIAMPFYQNGSLKSLMATRMLTTREIIRYAIQFISGVAHIHSKCLVHLDIKPDNILLSDNNEALLSDFGLADYTDENGWYQVTCHYIKHTAPEIHQQNGWATVQFDIFQIGLTLYRMCAGDKAFNAQFERVATSNDSFLSALTNKKFPTRSIILPHIPEPLMKIVCQCLEVDVEKRYNNVRDILNDLSKIDYNGLDWQCTESDTSHEWNFTDEKGLTYQVTRQKGEKAYTVVKNNRKTTPKSDTLRDYLLTLK